jgi:hypothetical protein
MEELPEPKTRVLDISLLKDGQRTEAGGRVQLGSLEERGKNRRMI